MRPRLRMSLALSVLMLACVGAAASEPTPPPAAATPDTTYRIGDPIPERRIAVMDLKVSGDYCEQVKDWFPALLEDRLLKEGWTLVVRGERMEHIQDERSMPGVKPETVLPDQELLSATAFIELSARIQVKDIQGIVGYKIFQFGDYARASVDVNGQIVDPATGVLKSSMSVGASASGLKTSLVVSIGEDWRVGAGGYNLRGVRESLVGKAADGAAAKLIDKLKALYPTIPAQRPPVGIQPASTTVTAEPGAPTILIALPDGAAAAVGDRFGVYREDSLVAEVEIVRLAGKRAEARVVTQSGPIRPTDIARKSPVVISAE